MFLEHLTRVVGLGAAAARRAFADLPQNLVRFRNVVGLAVRRDGDVNLVGTLVVVEVNVLVVSILLGEDRMQQATVQDADGLGMGALEVGRLPGLTHQDAGYLVDVVDVTLGIHRNAVVTVIVGEDRLESSVLSITEFRGGKRSSVGHDEDLGVVVVGLGVRVVGDVEGVLGIILLGTVLLDHRAIIVGVQASFGSRALDHEAVVPERRVIPVLLMRGTNANVLLFHGILEGHCLGDGREGNETREEFHHHGCICK